MHLEVNTENFLHTNPDLYMAFHSDSDHRMGQFIHKLLDTYKVGNRILDIGSGLGREVAYLQHAGYEATGLDNSREMISWATEHYPDSTFVYGEQSNFSLDQTFDAIVCVGSTFLYNLTNEEARASLKCFRNHLRKGGILYLDMRNASFFLTKEGQNWLTDELVDHTSFEDKVVTLRTKFSINLARQLLERDYCWTVPGYEPVVERLQHRLYFPQEMVHYVTSSGFRLIQLFDQPEPHISKFDKEKSLDFSDDLQGRRMQIIAQAI
ncbi:bifunctional 2-polyprenyl-6-hydroxyphenol methylase/3-demethylubiquinol 3-O-methyltransferase UbiG [Halalkalibacter sp. APA_J-10(15)]|uniref:class I SAM-dependent methyltransferase n=1 Tax=Halalkalibacter sp. APA_J-10(15) TaxID=2933805 RepID=UPI001FF2DCF7|nr:class I SAM-dependent methyltransferase [Halalkalibacter sp. APA_J-10(15)]MCK0473716.1 class I SAM-dependent methyltransferase [Halalkalibacter sp. APA_J-10(15)]